MRLDDTPFFWCGQKMSYCRCSRNAIDENMGVVKGVCVFKCWLFDKPYMDMYLMSGGTHRMGVFVFEICQMTAVRIPIFVG